MKDKWINEDYVRKEQLREFDFLIRHMEPEDQLKYLHELQFRVNHRTIGHIYSKIRKYIRLFREAFYLY